MTVVARAQMTEPTCAACLNPISKGHLGKVVGTEVFHHTCIKAGRVNRSQLRLAHEQIQQLEDDLAQLRKRYDKRGEAVQAATTLVGEANAKLRDYKRQLRAEVEERQRLFDAMADAKRQRDLALIERDAARSEAALHQLLARQAPNPALPTGAVVAASAADPEPEKEAIDASKLRFELIELS